MNPHQRNKIDISSLSPEEQRLFRLYGKLPNRNDLLQNKLKERKYFDSGDYALSKAGKASDAGVTQVGREHPVPGNIPHSSSPHTLNSNHILNPILGPGKLGHAGSPVKESSYLQRETSAEDMEAEEETQQEEMAKKEEGDEGSEHAKNRPVAIQQ